MHAASQSWKGRRKHLEVVLHKAGLDGQGIASHGQVDGLLHQPDAGLSLLPSPGLYQPQLGVLVSRQQTLLANHACKYSLTLRQLEYQRYSMHLPYISCWARRSLNRYLNS